ncbi:Flp family type IVb pilin [candidate division CSSED10-310 bacterium]|uniref:Flp family type IVb pilin n=1 Tax=candidate division CSSED10-310 bacterium TaxID=2855610 RepID=A0ABV6Z0H0_UNCC1
MYSKLKELYADESGQGYSEYILLVVLVAITVAKSFNLFRTALQSYYRRITYWVSLPIP